MTNIQPSHRTTVPHYGYSVVGYTSDGSTMFLCLQDGILVGDRHAHDDWHRALPFMATISTPDMADLLQREPGQDFE